MSYRAGCTGLRISNQLPDRPTRRSSLIPYRSYCPSRPQILVFKDSSIYHYGSPTNDESKALFSRLSWLIGDDGSTGTPDCWAVIGGNSSGREDVLRMILGQCRVDPPGSVKYPMIEHLNSKSADAQSYPISPQDFFKVVQFRSRLENLGSNNTGFSDYTARYYGIRSEHQCTLHEFLKSRSSHVPSDDQLSKVVNQLNLHQFINLPLITFSNGQSRRASIAHALLSGSDGSYPHVLILEEPYTGLDEYSREELSILLQTLHQARSPRIILFLRPQDLIPNFVTHLLILSTSSHNPPSKRINAQGRVAQVSGKLHELRSISPIFPTKTLVGKTSDSGKELVKLNSINISYADRHVLRDVNWSICEGDRWSLSGSNGSGKSTLLSLIMGDHPRSFTEDIRLFGRPRMGQATTQIHSHIGHVSPEIFNAFPRRFGETGLTVLETITTGFESAFCYRALRDDRQKSQLKRLFQRFDHPLLLRQDFLERKFAELSIGEQSLVLLLRALVKEPSLVIVDEPFSGMDDEAFEKSRNYLTHGLSHQQALIFVSHYRQELPDCINRKLHLRDGRAVEWPI